MHASNIEPEIKRPFKIFVYIEINIKMSHEKVWCEIMDWIHFEQEIRAESRLGHVMEIRYQ
jgi:hypothetical protein